MQKINTKSKNLWVFNVAKFIGILKRRIKKSKHRRYVLDQWLTTQQSFNRDISSALEFIKKPLLSRQLITKEGINTLFPQFEGMLQLSKLMISTVSIIRKQKNPNFIIIGDQLVYFASFYKLYGTYFGNRLKSQKLLKQLSETHPQDIKSIEQGLRQHVKSLDKRKQNMSISDCLQQPQYRMFKYVLLMKDYIKKLPKIHKDYKPLCKALDCFEKINLYNNDLMVKLEAQDKKVKLDRLFGKSIGNSSEFIVQMSADTLYFPVKLYIFNNLVIISAIDNTLGFIDERRYLNLYLNQFSYIHSKPNAKYYKNCLLLCGQYEAIHCFLPDPGERQEILSSIGKVIKQLQKKAIARRQQKYALSDNSIGKLSFAIQTHNNSVFASEFRIQVVKVEVRPYSSFSNDTVYLTRFMGPMYTQDQQAIKGQQKVQNSDYIIGVWQLAQVHLSQVVQLHKQLKEQYPSIKFPQIDPLTKQINAFTNNKKNTKTFQVRAYLFEQFFNFLFRHPTIILQPSKWISKYKIVSSFWQYHCKKNDYISGREQTKKEITYRYGQNHCELCKIIIRSNINQLQTLRRQFLLNKRTDNCFNAFNLFRLKMFRFANSQFSSFEKIILRQYYESGRLDYALIPRQQLYCKYQEFKIYYTSQNKYILAYSDYKRKVGQVLIEVGVALNIDNILDFRLVLIYEGKERILDQDQILFDLIKKFNIPAQEKEDQKKISRATYSQTSINQEEGFFSFFKTVNPFSVKLTSYLCLRKMVFLPKEIQLKSIEKNPSKGEIMLEELFSRLLLGEIPLETQDWAQISALWLIIHYWGTLEGNNPNKSINLVFEKIMPSQKRQMITQQSFLKVYLETYQQYSGKIKNKIFKVSNNDMLGLVKRCIRVLYRSVKSYTYTIQVTAKIVPDSLISDGLGKLQGQCFLGINYKQLVVFRSKESLKPAIKLSLEDIRVTNTTFSIFIEFSYFLSNPTNSSLSNAELSKSNLRFDARMMSHFQGLLTIYQNLKRIFPQVIA